MDELEAILETGGAAAVEIAASALAERGGPMLLCPNCAHPLVGPYCALCGQPHNTHRRALGHLLHDFVKDIVSFDSRILRTARALLFQPGELPKAFREGRTQRYMPAVRLYLFVSLLFFLFLSASGIAFLQFGVQLSSMKLVHDSAGRVYELKDNKRTLMPHLKSDARGNVSVTIDDPDSPSVALPPSIKANGDENQTITTKARFFRRVGDPELKMPPSFTSQVEQFKKQALSDKEGSDAFTRAIYATLTKFETDPAALNGPLMTWIPRILFILLPLFAVLLATFYVRKRHEFFFVDHLVFSLTMHTFAFVALIAAAAAAQIISGNTVLVIAMVVISFYVLLSIKRFYGQTWLTTGLKFTGIAVIYSLFFLAPALALAIAASVLSG
jgi:hypothetical protein